MDKEKKLQKLKDILEILDHSVTREDFLESFTKVVNLVKDLKDQNSRDMMALKETIKKVESKLSNSNSEEIEKIKSQMTSSVEKLIESTNAKLEKAFKEQADALNFVRDKVRGLENGIDGKDGKDGQDGSPDTPEQIVEKLESLDGEGRLDASAIKNLPEATKQIVGGVVARNLYQMGDVSLTNLADNDIIKWDDTNKLWINSATGSGPVDGSGTTNELPYWVDSNTLGSLAVATYPSLTELSYVKGVTSAIQTQFASYLPLAGGTMVGNILMTSNKLIGGSTTTSDLTLQTTTGVGTTGADMHFLVGNNGATEAMTILNNGNIGIGTTVPATKLEVQGTTPSIRATGTSGTVPSLELSSAGIVNWKLQSNWDSASGFAILQDATGRLVIKTGGNVGIGLTSPTAYLHIKAGTATASTAPIKLTAGTVNTTPESGAIEYDGTDFYLTVA